MRVSLRLPRSVPPFYRFLGNTSRTASAPSSDHRQKIEEKPKVRSTSSDLALPAFGPKLLLICFGFYPSSHKHSICARVPGRSISVSRDPLSDAMLVGVRVSTFSFRKTKQKQQPNQGEVPAHRGGTEPPRRDRSAPHGDEVVCAGGGRNSLVFWG